jgi:ketosteroid isomerase-like protein
MSATQATTPVEFMREYERCTNTHQFQQVEPLIAENAIFWFNDGSYRGRSAIRQAFEQTWDYIQSERYSIENVQWLVNDHSAAVCVYTFHWQGIVDGRQREGTGRGTSVLKRVGDRWQVIHEHLSPLPA